MDLQGTCEWCDTCLPAGECNGGGLHPNSWFRIGDYSCPRNRISSDCVYIGKTNSPSNVNPGTGNSTAGIWSSCVNDEDCRGMQTCRNGQCHGSSGGTRNGGRSNCDILSMEHCIADPRCEVCNRPYGFGGYDPNIPSTYCANRGQCRTNQNQNQTRSQNTIKRPPVPGPGPVPGPPNDGLHSMAMNYVNQHGGTGGIMSQSHPSWNDWEGTLTHNDMRGLVNVVRSNQRLHNSIMGLANNPRMNFHNIAKNIEAQLMRNGNTQRIYNSTKASAARNMNVNDGNRWSFKLDCGCDSAPTCCYVVLVLIICLMLL